MNAATVLLLLLPITAGFALLQRRRLYAILAMSVLSLLLSAVYLLAAAPDVAITEAAIGAALVTFIYVLAIRRTGRLTIVASEVPGLIAREGEGIGGLEWDMLEQTARRLGVEPVVRFVSHDEAAALIESGEADVAAGGILPPASPGRGRSRATRSHLPTARFTILGPESAEPGEASPFSGYLSDLVAAVRRGEPLHVSMDLARFLHLTRHGLEGYRVVREPGDLGYCFLVSSARPAVYRELEREVDRLLRSGELDRMARRYLT